MSTFSDESEWEVEEIRQRRVHDGRIQYLVKWANYPEASSTWTDEDCLNCPEKVVSFFERMAQEKAPPPPARILPTKFISHAIDAGKLFFELLYSDGTTRPMTTQEAKRGSVTLLLEYLEGITALRIEE
jgi:hypothetical protein